MHPLWIFLILLVGLPLIELYFLIQVGSFIGALPTIVLSVFTAVLGGLLMRQQGLSTAMRVQKSMARGEVPALEMMEGMAILVAGGVLLLPGFMTDALGFLLLIPWVRRFFLLKLVRPIPQAPSQPDQATPLERDRPQTGDKKPNVIEGEYIRHDEKP
jgi:UPF0716 protein FxsA